MTGEEQFAESGAHILMITNHGVHEWSITPGLTDTGGQNLYVNQFTWALVDQGYRVTIVNRGGFPHPVTGTPLVGTMVHPTGRARIMYIEDGTPAFVRKEDMNEHVPSLVADLRSRLAGDTFGHDLIISNYWDAGKIGAALNDVTGGNAPHIWIPHSLGALKKRNVDPATWASLRIDERIEHETELLQRVDGTVATSSSIREILQEDYAYQSQFFLPPCVDASRYHPRKRDECAAIWDFLAAHSHLTAAEIGRRRIITEISRTDRTKRKEVLVRALARVRERIPGPLLVMALDERAGAPYEEVMGVIRDLELEGDVIVLGSVWDQLPCLYAVSAVYCTPSVMEGFGMSAQEAAASGVPVVASDLVPFVREHLLGAGPRREPLDGERGGELLVGDGAIVVPADDVDGFARALATVLSDDVRREAMGRSAFAITVPSFTWARRTQDLLDALKISPDVST